MPIIFTIFANPHGDLKNLAAEQNGIQDALYPLHAAGKLEHLLRTNTDRKAFFDMLHGRPNDEFVILHYGGHASRQALTLQESEVSFREMAGELFSRNQKSLQLVFLNGCSTAGHVQYLLDAGIPAVIATSTAVPDLRAKDLAVRFYQNLAIGQSIPEAYRSAARYVNSGELSAERKIREDIQDLRGLKLDDDEAVFPWGLYAREGKALREQPLLSVRKVFNEHLSRHLIEAVRGDCLPADRFLERVAGQAHWETQARIADKAREILAYSFVGPIGIQLSKLMAIGKEEMPEGKPAKYIKACLSIAGRTLDLVSFALLSRLWDARKDSALPLPEAITQRLQTPFEPSLEEQFGVLAALHGVFANSGSELPLPQLARLDAELAEGSQLHQCITRLQDLREKLDSRRTDLSDCFPAEKCLAEFLAHFSFLAAWKMASIKHIGYRQGRQPPPHYLHRYAALGIDSKANVDAEKIKPDGAPTFTESVLLYQGEDYNHGINLAPFVIDYNALTFETGTRILFYQSMDTADERVIYRVLDDDTEKALEPAAVPPAGELGQFLLDDKNRSKFNLHNVVSEFREARKALLAGFPDLDDL